MYLIICYWYAEFSSCHRQIQDFPADFPATSPSRLWGLPDGGEFVVANLDEGEVPGSSAGGSRSSRLLQVFQDPRMSSFGMVGNFNAFQVRGIVVHWVSRCWTILRQIIPSVKNLT